VVVPGIVPNNLFILIYEPMKAKINNQLKSESFQGLFCAQIQNKYMKSSCKESYIRPFESSGFKQNLPRERRKNLYSRVYYFLVAQGIEPNGCYQKRVMHSCRDYFKNQLESESFQGLSCALIQDENIVSSCKESYIRPFERDGFKQNLPCERRKNLYSDVYELQVALGNRPNSHFQKSVMHPCSNISQNQLESESFHGLSCAVTQDENILSSCKESYIRPLESDGFKQNLPCERRKDLYSDVYKFQVALGNTPNSHFQKRVMHSCSKISYNQLESDSFHGLSCAATQDNIESLRNVKIFIKNTYVVDVIKYYELSNDNHYYFNKHKHVLMRISTQHFKKKIAYINKRKDSICKIIKKQSFVLIVESVWHPQSIFSTLMSIPDMITSSINVCDKISKSVADVETRLLIADLIVLILNIREGYFTGIKFLTTLVSILTLSSRAKNISKTWFQQSMSGNDLLLLLTTIGLPSSTLELRNFSALSGKKLLDCLGLVDLITQTIEVAIQIIDYFAKTFQLCTWIDLSPAVDILKGIFEYFSCHNKVKKVVECYTSYVKDQQIMFDPVYRQKVIEVYDSLKADVSFLSYVSNEANKFFQSTWNAFVNNVVKFARNFDATSRKEPICIVFEGEAGSGKSTLMNTFVELLRSMNKSIYVHTVPPVEGGKDFYDDYEGQQVFVMDDVGQQSVAQWRSIINMVSPVRFPLECAAANKKNTKFFESEIILCTANHFSGLHGFTKADCISEPEALFRRVHVIKCRRNQELDLQYFKFDHLGTKKWRNQFLYHYERTNIPSNFKGTLRDSIIWLAKLHRHVEACDKVEAANVRLNNDDFKLIREELEDFYDAEDEELYGPQILTSYWNLMHFGVPIISEFVNGIGRKIQEISEFIFGKISSNPLIYIFSLAISLSLTVFVKNLFLDSIEVLPAKIEEQWELAWKKLEAYSYSSQSTSTKASDLSQFSRVARNRVTGDVTHAIVSGRKLLLPSHLQWDGTSIDIYQSWEHLSNNHIELELRKIKLLRSFYSVDLAVYEFDGFIPMYKKCHALFASAPETGSPLCHIVATSKVCPVIRGVHITPNESVIRYATTYHSYVHRELSGFTTPLTNAGLCGAFLVDSRGIIIGIHVAGCEDKGFMVTPVGYVRDEIRRIMLDTPENKFNLSNKVIPNFSGVRMHYEVGEISKKYPNAKTSFVETQLHSDYSLSTATIMQELDVSPKGPPIVDKPVACLEKQGLKTFSHQGQLQVEEIAFIEKFFDRMMIPYQEIEDDNVVVFGDSEITRLNPKSSNGYEVDSKKEFFDYDNKLILEEGRKYLDDYKQAFLDDDFDIRKVLCIETFKDEIRVEEKRETPRTFRVMPLGHIFYCKKLMGKLIQHFKDHRLEFGVGVGLNPYKDFDTIARQLKECTVLGDLDFKKWDGSVPVDILQIIKTVLLKYYEGRDNKLLERLLETTIRSYVLIYDGVFATTHGVPSGTWLTLLINSLTNAGLRALTIFRNGGTLEDTFSVVDYNVGDDKIFGSKGQQTSMYNLKTLAAVAKSLNMECTNGDKTPVVSFSQPFSKLSFLKRSFIYHKEYDRYMGALSPETIFNTLQWYDKTKDYNIVMEGKVKAMQVESYIHGLQFYNMYKRYIEDNALGSLLFPDVTVIDILFNTADYKLVCSLADKDISWL
jgi:hypothetical protein